VRDLSRYQAEYTENNAFESHMVLCRRRQILECLTTIPHQHVLEVSCGLEPLVQHVDEWKTWDIVEPAPEFASRARALITAGKQLTVHEATIESAAPTLAGRHFDFICVSGLLHEVVDPVPILEAVRGLCGNDSIVHVNVPNARSLHNRIGVLMGVIPDVFTLSPLAHRLQRNRSFDLEALASLVRQSGFEVISSGSYFLKPFTHEQMQKMLDLGIIDRHVLDALYEVNRDLDGLGAEIHVNLKRR
jgi:SAM-dependent methyltransferase